MEPNFQAAPKPEQLTIDDAYVRQKIDEAYADSAKTENGFAPLDMAAVRTELQRRLSLSQDSGGE
jgi:hypothetical protein